MASLRSNQEIVESRREVRVQFGDMHTVKQSRDSRKVDDVARLHGRELRVEEAIKR